MSGTGNVVNDPNFKSQGDWIERVIHENCTEITQKAGEAEVNEEGKTIRPARKEKRRLSVDKLVSLANENGLEPKEYANPGMYRMNVGNMLRGVARRRHGLNINGEFVSAPSDFAVNETRTEEPDGSPVAKEDAA